MLAGLQLLNAAPQAHSRSVRSLPASSMSYSKNSRRSSQKRIALTPAQAELVDAVLLAQSVRGKSLSQIPDSAILSILLEIAPDESTRRSKRFTM